MTSLTPQSKYTNRELSWLEFNQRVLDQAFDEKTPLLERLKFLSISGSNLDEFFMVRVGGLLIQNAQAPDGVDIVGWSPKEQLSAIRDRVLTMVGDQYRGLNQILDELEQNGVRRVTPEHLQPNQRAHLARVFEEEIFSVVSPIAVDDAHNFPAMIGATIGLCVRLKGDVLSGVMDSDEKDGHETSERFAVLPLRRGLDRIWTVPSESGIEFVLLDDLISMFTDRFFPNQEVLETVVFRTMRNADVTVDERAADLLAGMKTMLLERRTSDCVRLEVAENASRTSTDFLVKCLELESDLVYRIAGPVDLAALMSLCSVQGFRELKFEPWPPMPPPDFSPDEDIFEVIAARDRVLIHPFQEYQPVVDFVVAAANDPNVIAIKQTLYRTSRNSEIVNALRRAAEAGKHVTVIVELKARFDEQRNIRWARKLEEAGVDVVFGVRGFKTHAKICMVIRKEPGGVRRYLHFGSGNYNEVTARIYGDISLFTCDPELGIDSVNLFNAITGLSIPRPMKKLVAAPIELRSKLEELIDAEIENALDGRAAMIRAKFNSLVDRKIIDRLYKASAAGVKIELNVRGISCLRAGVPGLSENIRVISVVDRFLEHARIFYFLHGGDHRVFIASADWMGRNLDRRIELMVPVLDVHCADRVNKTLQTFFEDNMSAYELGPDGKYVRLSPVGSEKPHRSQEHLYSVAKELFNEMGTSTSQTFKAHRSNSESA